MHPSLRGHARRAYVDLPWGQIHLRMTPHEDLPADAPTVVMLHQSPLSSVTFDAALPLLARRGIRAYAMDLPGFGMSDPLPGAWEITDAADAIRDVIEELGLARVWVLGQHTGATVAADLAVRHGQTVAGLILMGLPLYEAEERAAKLASYAPGYTPAREGSYLQVIWQRIHGLYPHLEPAAAARQVGEYHAVGPDYGIGYRAVFRYEVDVETLRSVPILLLHGERDVVHRMTPAVTAALPHARLVVVPDASDFLPDERTDAFVAAIADQVHASSRPHLTT